MAKLGLAGMISGMGQGLERGLQQMQSGFIQQGLQDADRAFQSEKLKLQMEHAERLQLGSIGAAAEQNRLNREQAVTLEDRREKGATDRSKAAIDAGKENAQTQAGTHIVAAGMQAASHEKISEQTLAANKEIARLKYIGDTRVAKASDLKETRALIGDLWSSRDTLVKEIGKAMADPIEKEQNKLTLSKIDKDIAYYQEIFDTALGTAKPERPQPKKFVLPDMGGTPAPSVGTPAPLGGTPAPGPQSSAPPARGLVQTAIPEALQSPGSVPQSFGERLTDSLVDAMPGSYRPPAVQIVPRRP